VRRLLLALALTVGAVSVSSCTPGSHNCFIIRLPGGAPDDWTYIPGTYQWIVWIGGQPITMGYSQTEDSTIWNEYYCTLDNLQRAIRTS
jgi:hypothetical protein